MGTHASCPAYTSAKGKQTLSDYLIENPSLLSPEIVRRFDIALDKGKAGKSVLPFLLKILSAGKALSIQAHPDKKLAEKLHGEKPDMYKGERRRELGSCIARPLNTRSLLFALADDNHKPEMAIALTDFRGFCGFRPLAEVTRFLEAVPEFRGIVQPSSDLLRRLSESQGTGPESKALLKEVFSGLMKASDAEIQTWTSKLVQRHARNDALPIEESAEIPLLVRTLQEQFPNDIGLFCAYLLNHLRLRPGQALFLGANEPHAYLQGEIVECMAASDNVVRAGLTPKARDVSVLVGMLTYDHGPGERQYMQPKRWDRSRKGLTQLFEAPIPEFDVARIAFEEGKLEEEHDAVRGPSVLIQTTGQGKIAWEGGEMELEEGSVVFIAPGLPITLSARDPQAVAFRAFVEAS